MNPVSDVIHSVDGSIWQVEMDRPERANALRRRTIRQIEAVLDAAEAPESDAVRETGPDARGVLLTGGLERFSAGADLSELNGTIGDLGFDDELERLCRRLTLSPLPVVAAVEGACYGAAVDLAWACDTVVVSDEARLGLPSTSLGILYNPSSVARLHARLGSPTVRRLMSVATGMGLDRPILHGLATMGMTARAVSAAVGAHPADLSAARVRFSNPVYPGCKLRIAAATEGATARAEASVKDANVMSGTFTF